MIIPPLGEKYEFKFHNWVISSTGHGIPNMFRTENTLIRIIWIVSFLGSLGYCTYTIVKSIIDYSKYETIVSITRVQELPQTFPAVTICNLNPYNTANAEALQYLYLFANSMNNSQCLDYYSEYNQCIATNSTGRISCKELKRVLETQCYTPITTFNLAQLKLYMANFIDDSINEIIGYDLGRDMLLECSFNGKVCTASNFTKYWSSQFGFCYTFNNGERLLKTSNKGGSSGLQLELAVESVQGGRRYSDYSGLYLVVHNQSALPYTLYNGIILPTGKKMIIDVNRLFIEKLPSPYSDCIDALVPDSDNAYSIRLFSFFASLNITSYEQDVCFNLCYQDRLIDKCNCSSLVTPVIRNRRYCWTNVDFECLDAFDREYFRSDLNVFCDRACPLNCKSIDYKLGVQYSSYPSLDRIKYFNDSGALTFPSVDSNELEILGQRALLQLNINYQSTLYDSMIENESSTFETLLGSIGGQLGLFIGISFLSLVEIVELAIDLFYIYLDHRKEKFKLNEMLQRRVVYPSWILYPVRLGYRA